jgi:hypothetical protein
MTYFLILCMALFGADAGYRAYCAAHQMAIVRTPNEYVLGMVVRAAMCCWAFTLLAS